MTTLRKQHQSKAAYTLVDLSGLDDDLRKDIILDANEGGGIYGIRVVEESVNGGARAPIYGVYNEGPDADRWASAKDKLGISGDEVDDSEIYSGSGVEVNDARKEAALREAAAQQAERDAQAIRAGEDEEIRSITGDDEDESATPRRASRPTALDHTVNIVDPDAIDAENEVSKVPSTEASKKPASNNKAPK